MIKLRFVIIVLIIVLFSIASGYFYNRQFRNKQMFMTISAIDAKQLIETESEDGVLILDVRSFDEYCTGHIFGSANTPLDTLKSSPMFRTIDKNRLVIIYSQTGQKGSLASQIFADNGLARIYNIEGGIESWINENFTVTEPIDHSSSSCGCEE